MEEDEKAFAASIEKNPHLGEYFKKITEETGKRPEFHMRLTRDMEKMENPNVVYPVGDPIFVHIFKGEKGGKKYFIVEPEFLEEVRKKYDKVFDSLVELVPKEKEPVNKGEFKEMLDRMVDIICVVGKKRGIISKIVEYSPTEKVYVTKSEMERIRYELEKDLIGQGVLEPFMRDPYIEDVNCVGLGNLFIVHKIFGTLETDVGFTMDLELDEYIFRLSEKIDKPVSSASPIIDGALPDGSRINIIYSRDISKKGSSFTIRKFSETPISITQLVDWGTLSSEIAAYLWLCLENGMSVFICGETASGKTSTLNAISTFIRSDSKIFSIEDTPEIRLPHACWQQMNTRETKGKSEEAEVPMFDLLKAALRSRPHYIIPGELRGKEAYVAFQGMQTGHPCVTTFHASSVKKMIQRLTGDPINVRLEFIDSLNAAMVQQLVYRKGRLLRKVLDITEIEGYSRDAEGILSRGIVEWRPSTNKHIFKGMYNSYVLEEKIAMLMGLEDKREVYDEMLRRSNIIREMVNHKIFDFFEVFDVVERYRIHGLEGLPFVI